MEIQGVFIRKERFIAEAVHVIGKSGAGLPIDQESIRGLAVAPRDAGAVGDPDVVVVRIQLAVSGQMVDLRLAAGCLENAVFDFHGAAVHEAPGQGVAPNQAILDADDGSGQGLEPDAQVLVEDGPCDVQPGVGLGIDGVGDAMTDPDPVHGNGLAILQVNAGICIGHRQRVELDAVGIGQLDPIGAEGPAGALQDGSGVGAEGVPRHADRISARSGVLHADQDGAGFLVGARIHPDPISGLQIESIERQSQRIQRRIGRRNPVVRQSGSLGIDVFIGIGRADEKVEIGVANGEESRGLGPDVGVFLADHAPQAGGRIGKPGHGPGHLPVRGHDARSHRVVPGLAAVHRDLHLHGFGGEPAARRPDQGNRAIGGESRIAERDGLDPQIVRRAGSFRRPAISSDFDPAAIGHGLVGPGGRSRISRVQQGGGDGIRRPLPVGLDAAQRLLGLQVIVACIGICHLRVARDAVDVLPAGQPVPGRQIVGKRPAQAAHPREGAGMQAVVVRRKPVRARQGHQRRIGDGRGQEAVFQRQFDGTAQLQGVDGVLPENAVLDRDVRGLVQIDAGAPPVRHAPDQPVAARVAQEFERLLGRVPHLHAVQFHVHGGRQRHAAHHVAQDDVAQHDVGRRLELESHGSGEPARLEAAPARQPVRTARDHDGIRRRTRKCGRQPDRVRGRVDARIDVDPVARPQQFDLVQQGMQVPHRPARAGSRVGVVSGRRAIHVVRR